MSPRSNPNPPITKIENGLYLGDIQSSHQVSILRAHNITAMVSLTREAMLCWRRPGNRELVPEQNHLYIPCADSSTFDLLPNLAAICDFIDRFRPRDQHDSASASASGDVPGILVHCEMGISRSATAMLAYLMRAHEWDLDTALVHIQEKRKVKPNSNFVEQLTVWAETKYEIWERSNEDGNVVPKPAYAAYLARRAGRLRERGLTGNEPVVHDL